MTVHELLRGEATARELIRAGLTRRNIRHLVRSGTVLREQVTLAHARWHPTRQRYVMELRRRAVYRLPHNEAWEWER